MAETVQKRYGVQVLQIWGMTETCPLGVVGTPTPALAAHGEEQMWDTLWTRQGRLQFGIEARCIDEEGNEVPRDGTRSEEHTSELQSLMRISYAVFCLKKKNTIQIYRENESSNTT